MGYSYFGKQLLNKGQEIENLFNEGRTYLRKISCPVSLKHAEYKSNMFHQKNDFNGICSYTQHIRLKGEMTYMFTNKLLLDDKQTISICYFLEDMGKIGGVFKEIAPKVFKNQCNYQKFQSLTKQEKKIIELIAKGLSNKEIGEQLFISPHTVHTHRKNIYHKLDIKNISELVRFSLILDLF